MQNDKEVLKSKSEFYRLFTEDNNILGLKYPFNKQEKVILSCDSIFFAFLRPFIWRTKPEEAEVYGLCVNNNNIVSKCVVNFQGPYTENGNVFITHFVTAEGYRHKGYGTELLKNIVDFYSDRVVLLGVEPDNYIAYAMYLKSGFKVMKRNCIDKRFGLLHDLLVYPHT